MENLKEYLPESINGKTVLITGGTTGIGRAIAILLVSQGAKVMIFGRHQQELDDAMESIKATYPQAETIGLTADVAKQEDIKRVFEAVDSKFGRLDILINNAGLSHGSIMEGTHEDWEYVVQTNLVGYMACAREAIKRMQQNKSGHIIDIGSMSADTRGKDSSVYVATKAGVQGFTEALRKEVNPMGIKVTLIEPGAVGADMQEISPEEQRRKIESLEMLKAEDIAMSVLYCLSQPKRTAIVTMQIRPLLQPI